MSAMTRVATVIRLKHIKGDEQGQELADNAKTSRTSGWCMSWPPEPTGAPAVGQIQEGLSSKCKVSGKAGREARIF